MKPSRATLLSKFVCPNMNMTSIQSQPLCCSAGPQIFHNNDIQILWGSLRMHHPLCMDLGHRGLSSSHREGLQNRQQKITEFHSGCNVLKPKCTWACQLMLFLQYLIIVNFYSTRKKKRKQTNK